MDRLKQVLNEIPGVQLVTDDGDYLRAECTTPLLNFVDDIEFLHDQKAGVIHVRSASRVGRSDLDANRKRVEEIRKRLAEQSSA